ncbi:MAG: zinc ribbon domain-containing protein [Thermoplasmata archaeon]
MRSSSRILDAPEERDWGVVVRPGPRPIPYPVKGGGFSFKCARCGIELLPEWLFCPDCGTGIGWVRLCKVELQCGICGEPLEPGWERCPACAYPVGW